jgi:preprotein translocase subunit YajC
MVLAAICMIGAGTLAQTTQPSERPELAPAPTGKPAAAPAEAPKAPATTQPGAKAPGGPQAPDDGKGMLYFYVAILGGFILLYVWMGRSRRKTEAKRREMLGNLSKGDKIITIGGIIGTVVEVRPNEVTVKVDETNNVRMKFLRSAISRVGEEVQDEKDKERASK